MVMARTSRAARGLVEVAVHGLVNGHHRGFEHVKTTLRRFLLAGLLAGGMVAPTSAAAQVVTGSGKGSTHADVPGSSTEVPLLKGFQLGYEHGDNHIKKIELWPNRVPPDSGDFDRVRFTLADKRPWRPRKDRFRYFADFYMGPLFGAQVHDLGAPVSFTVPGSRELPPPPNAASVFALVGFSLRFECKDDHHIARIAVREDDGNLLVAFEGGWGGPGIGCPSYTVEVLYTWIHPLDLYDWGTVSGSAPASFDAFVPLRGGTLIVRGFDFRVSEPDKDQHLALFGVTAGSQGTGGVLQTHFADQHGATGSLPYDWTVDWAELGQRYFQPPEPRPLNPELLRDSEAARRNAEEWARRRGRPVEP